MILCTMAVKSLNDTLDVDLEALPIKSNPERDTKVKESSKDWITDALIAAALMVTLCEYIKYLESVFSPLVSCPV